MPAVSAFLCRLQFDAPVHFGAAELGGGLERTASAYPSDTLFAALCTELAAQGLSGRLAALYARHAAGGIAFSDLLPYRMEHGELQLCLPKPVLLADRTEEAAPPLDDARRAQAAKKRLKQLAHIRASRFGAYFAALRQGRAFEDAADFGAEAVVARLHARAQQPRPYRVRCFSFAQDAGLAVLLRCADEEAAGFARLFASLGLSGIGGKRASGYGRFHVAGGCEPLAAVPGADAQALRAMLGDAEAPWQMCLSSLLPRDEDLPQLAGAQYRLRKRSGFVTPEVGAAVQKKRSVYMIAAGSCLRARIAGRIETLGQYCGHAVWRSGVCLYAGVRP